MIEQSNHADVILNMDLPSFKYTFSDSRGDKEVTKENRKVNFNKANYYEQIPGGEINKNPLLVRNDGY